jgi:predicted acylesterase/phospholipase RssA
MNKKIRILSIDGGGIRGIIPAVILNHVEKRLQFHSGNPDTTLADYFDLVAGTSAGGILACYYLLPPKPGQESHSRYFASEAIDMYAKHGKEIFNRKLLRFGIAKEKYPVAGLEKVLKDCMGEVTLAQSRKNCIITAYDVSRLFRPGSRHQHGRNTGVLLFASAAARAGKPQPVFRFRSYRHVCALWKGYIRQEVFALWRCPRKISGCRFGKGFEKLHGRRHSGTIKKKLHHHGV